MPVYFAIIMDGWETASSLCYLRTVSRMLFAQMIILHCHKIIISFFNFFNLYFIFNYIVLLFVTRCFIASTSYLMHTINSLQWTIAPSIVIFFASMVSFIYFCSSSYSIISIKSSNRYEWLIIYLEFCNENSDLFNPWIIISFLRFIY